MPYQVAIRLPDRYAAFFVKGHEARRVWITAFDFDRADRDRFVQNLYSPGPGWAVSWYAPYIETFDTPSGDLEPGMVWEGMRLRTNPITKRRELKSLMIWRDVDGDAQEGDLNDLVVTRTGAIPEKIERKRP